MPTLSVAVKAVISTDKEFEVAGIEKEATTGLFVSGKEILTVSLKAVETLPAASFTQA